MRTRLQRLALLIPAQEIHPGVHTGGIATEDVVDEADLFDVLAPVQVQVAKCLLDKLLHAVRFARCDHVVARLTKVILAPSGDHAGLASGSSASVSRTGAEPSAFIT